MESRLRTGLDLSIVDPLGNNAFLAACFYGRYNCAEVFLSLVDQKELETFKSPTSGLSALEAVFKCVREESYYNSAGFYQKIGFTQFSDCSLFLEAKKKMLQQLMSVNFGGEEVTNNLRKSLEKSTCSTLNSLLALLSENGALPESSAKKAKHDDNQKAEDRRVYSSAHDGKHEKKNSAKSLLAPPVQGRRSGCMYVSTVQVRS